MALTPNDITGLLTSISGNNTTSNTSAPNSNIFSTPSIPSGNNFGLPSSSTPFNVNAISKRNIMHWFVPEAGVVDMYVNPQSVNYTFSKIIPKERTKGGYSVQYWGEELPTLRIEGTTGSSGVEGINVLYETYRSEQIAFDSIGLTLASSNAVNGLADAISGDSFLSQLGGDLLGINPLAQSLLPNNIPSLASMAFGIELYWSGWVFRGYFNSFDFTESADKPGLFNYTIAYTVTQRRGYRFNFMPWHHSAISGPSNHDVIPYTFEDTNARGGQSVSSTLLAENAAGVIGNNGR